jgi:agmatine/peptidylarginine deiminase
MWRLAMRRSMFCLVFFLCPALAAAQNPAGALDFESKEPAVVLMALGDHQAQFVDIGVQREIAKAALEAAPVIVFVDENKDLTDFRVKNTFKTDPVLNRAIKEGRLVFSVVQHDTVWIRDYGPQLVYDGKDSFTVINSKYKDVRLQITIDRDMQTINRWRKQVTNPIIMAPFDSVEKKNADAQKIKDYLFLLDQYEQILMLSKDYERKSDQQSPYEMMQVVTDRPEIDIQRPKLFLDGGNLIRLTDGRLISTKELYLRNPGKEKDLVKHLKQHFQLKDLVFLDPLPGPVIKHADMFVLPAAGKRILLASYEPATRSLGTPFDPHAEELDLLTEEAGKLMKKNKAVLEKQGYEVIEVPSFPPQIANNQVYYPTLLNGLSLQTRTGEFVVLVPYYPALDPYVQLAAHKKIRQAFGDKTRIFPIDCSRPATGQGAIHCLTATAPLRFSRFAGDFGAPTKGITSPQN